MKLEDAVKTLNEAGFIVNVDDAVIDVVKDSVSQQFFDFGGSKEAGSPRAWLGTFETEKELVEYAETTVALRKKEWNGDEFGDL